VVACSCAMGAKWANDQAERGRGARQRRSTATGTCPRSPAFAPALWLGVAPRPRRETTAGRTLSTCRTARRDILSATLPPRRCKEHRRDGKSAEQTWRSRIGEAVCGVMVVAPRCRLTTKLSEAGERAQGVRLQPRRARAPRPSLQRSG